MGRIRAEVQVSVPAGEAEALRYANARSTTFVDGLARVARLGAVGVA